MLMYFVILFPILKWKNNTTLSEQFKKTKRKMCRNRGKLDSVDTHLQYRLTHIYMTAHIPTWYRHFNQMWWG